ncbi:hypothetical protein G7075_14035 [Phycicoccus sp. HDW14]|uniref:hypothetical protein n=1 Tax=Phycicoccus sp. HDW14 TaxID=2714941 RepID=UPI0014082B57|nr:hypothetical protein [Phycicoccus sp. HDW14]QIM19872.1 hypothetical protein G7075_14035 [Phycicoccus sp. HDW14]
MTSGDPSLTDDDLQGEIDLVGALVIEASQSEGPMTQERIDEILGVADEEPAEADAEEPAEATGGSEGADGSDDDGAAG